MANFFDKRGNLRPGFTTRSWDAMGPGLLVPPGSVKKQQLRKNLQETPLEVHKKTKTVTMPKPVLHAFRMELSRLIEKHLETATDMTHVLAFENAANKLCDEYGVTLALAVDSTNTIIVQTEELIIEDAGDVSMYQQFSDKLHGGAKVHDDVETMFKPVDKMTDKDWLLIDE